MLLLQKSPRTPHKAEHRGFGSIDDLHAKRAKESPLGLWVYDVAPI